MLDAVAFYLSVEDPESNGFVENAYCALSEVHANFRTKTLVAVFECWRNREACLNNKRAFSVLEVPLEPDKGGQAYFEAFGLDGAKMQFGPNIRDFCLKHTEQLKTATPADKESRNLEQAKS